MSLQHFLQFLGWLREVIIQDAAILSTRNTNLQFLKYHPFNSEPFRNFVAVATQRLSKIENKARLQFKNLPEHIVRSLHGALGGYALEQAAERDSARATQEKMTRQLSALTDAFQDSLASKKSRRKGHLSTSLFFIQSI